MVTNADIEKMFLQEQMRLNNEINRVQFQFYKKDIERSLRLVGQAAKNRLSESQTITQQDNPLAGKEDSIGTRKLIP